MHQYIWWPSTVACMVMLATRSVQDNLNAVPQKKLALLCNIYIYIYIYICIVQQCFCLTNLCIDSSFALLLRYFVIHGLRQLPQMSPRVLHLSPTNASPHQYMNVPHPPPPICGRNATDSYTYEIIYIHIILDQHTENYDSRFMIQDSTNSPGCFQMLTCSLFVTPMADLEPEHTLARDVYACTWSPYRGIQSRQSKLLQLTSRSHLPSSTSYTCISLNTLLQIAAVTTQTHIYIYIYIYIYMYIYIFI